MITKENNIISEIADLAYVMWNKGWDESNGGNISYLLSDEEVNIYQEYFIEPRLCELDNTPEFLHDRYIAITASGSQFRTVVNNLERDIGIIKITPVGYEIVWGFDKERLPTSEVYMHLLSHEARLKIDPEHKVVVHNHATEATAYSLIIPPNDKEFTLPLWRVLTESIVVFPDGVGVLPWQKPGTEAIGKDTADKLKDCRIVVWAAHGILATGKDLQDCFGLIETVNKAADIYLKTSSFEEISGLTDDHLLEVCEALNVNPRSGFLKE